MTWVQHLEHYFPTQSEMQPLLCESGRYEGVAPGIGVCSLCPGLETPTSRTPIPTTEHHVFPSHTTPNTQRLVIPAARD